MDKNIALSLFILGISLMLFSFHLSEDLFTIVSISGLIMGVYGAISLHECAVDEIGVLRKRRRSVERRPEIIES